jgi:outer membrane receptor protein involved in Fe transport
VNAGRGGRTWDGFFSAAGRKGEEDESPYTLLRFWGDGNTPTPPEDRYGSAVPGSARYLEAYGRLAYKDRLIFSSRVAESERPYTMGDETGNISWRESRDLGSGYLKMEARSAFNSTATLRATGFYSWLHPEFQVIDRTLSQKENTSYGEGLYDQSLFSGRGLFSAGVSYRKKEVRNAPVWNGYFLDFLDPGNRFFLPIITREDYATRLWSVFGQYHHTIGKADFWLSLRSDDHDQYQDHLSYNAGVVWSPLSDWKIKLLYGTAYRTPFARQLLSDEVPDLEKIKSLNLQLAWNPTRRSGVTLTGFYNRLRNHINEDPYAGFRSPTVRIRSAQNWKGSLPPTGPWIWVPTSRSSITGVRMKPTGTMIFPTSMKTGIWSETMWI